MHSTYDGVYFIESDLLLPVFCRGPVSAAYLHRQSTKVLDLPDQKQEDGFHTRDELQLSLALGERLRIIAVGGYHMAEAVDRPGRLGAAVVGGGMGSSLADDHSPLDWHAMAGGYVPRGAMTENWWTDLSVSWRVLDLGKLQHPDSESRVALALGADVQTANRDDRFQVFCRAGPQLQFLAVGGTRGRIHLEWLYNDGNPFHGFDENAVMAGFDISAELDDHVVLARRERRGGLFPLAWGTYDVGLFTDRVVRRFDIHAEIADFVIARRAFTGVVRYESRTEHRAGDFDNIALTSALGVQTRVGPVPFLSRGAPLVAGVDFLHRSDHALNPGVVRTADEGEPSLMGLLIESGGVNILPRFRLQTPGWDPPYRDAGMYDRKTEWVNAFDWRVSAGYDAKSTRDLGLFAGQLGIHWDIATVEGHVVYARGIGSIGNESPDWLGELGVRRPIGRFFARYEHYGMAPNLARGNTLILGIGLDL